MLQRKKVRIMLLIVLLVFVILIGGLIGAYYISRVFLSGMTAAISIVVFFGFLIMSPSLEDGSISDKSMRLAITASFILTFLILTGTTAYFQPKTGELQELTSLFLTSFTTIVGVVIAFYFGASAYTERQDKKRQAEVDGKVTDPN